MHAEKALAYDVAIGICRISSKQLNKFRVEADWRFGEDLEKDNPNKAFSEYFKFGTMNEKSLVHWGANDGEATLPDTIDDTRQGGALLGIGGEYEIAAYLPVTTGCAGICCGFTCDGCRGNRDVWS